MTCPLLETESGEAGVDSGRTFAFPLRRLPRGSHTSVLCGAGPLLITPWGLSLSV